MHTPLWNLQERKEVTGAIRNGVQVVIIILFSFSLSAANSYKINEARYSQGRHLSCLVIMEELGTRLLMSKDYKKGIIK